MFSLPRGLNRSHDPTSGASFVRGEGVWLWDEAGKDYLDLTGGYSACNFGHLHPRLIAAATEQMGRLTFVTGGANPWRAQLMQELARLAPMEPPVKVWLATNGSRAIEIAWKIAFARRPGTLVHFDHGFHGRSIAVSNISDTPKLAVAQTKTLVAPFPDCIRCPFHKTPATCHIDCFDETLTNLEAQASSISAIIVEPLIGARGYLSAPDMFFHRLHAFAKKHEILLISDEIQMGLGRLGAIFAAPSQGWSPDLIVLGKSLGGGIVPISAVIGSAASMDALETGWESETFAGNPLACRIACEVLELLQDKTLLANGLEIGNQIRQLLRAELQHLKIQWVVEGEGAFAAAEFEPQDETQAANRGAKIAWDLAKAAFEHGVLVHKTGPFSNRIVLIPPLTMRSSELGELRSRLHSAWETLAWEKLELE